MCSFGCSSVRVFIARCGAILDASDLEIVTWDTSSSEDRSFLFRFLIRVPQGSSLSFGIADFVFVAVEIKNVSIHVNVESNLWHIVLSGYMDDIWCVQL